tara:strand:+ start:220 stop:777 length:558 start_codon:yes stop_codon:yes gene_type:complete
LLEVEKMKEFDKTGENDNEIIIRFLTVREKIYDYWRDETEKNRQRGNRNGTPDLTKKETEGIYNNEYKKIISKLPPNCKLISVTPADDMGEYKQLWRRLVLFFEIENSSPKKRKNIKYHFIKIRIGAEDGARPTNMGEEEWRLSVYNRKLAKTLEKLGGNARVKHAQWIDEWPGKGWQLIIENEE